MQNFKQRQPSVLTRIREKENFCTVLVGMWIVAVFLKGDLAIVQFLNASF